VVHGQQKIENWTLWIIGDLIVTPLYAYRGLGMLSLQYLIFTILAIYAYGMEENLTQRAICNYKNRNVWSRGTGKTTLAIQLAENTIKRSVFPSLRGATYRRNGIKTNLFVMLMICCSLWGQAKLENEKLAVAINICFGH
jgi:hypothetical protein